MATVPTLKLRKGAYGTDETELNEFHVVDNDVVFTVNVGATQQLIQRSESLETRLSHMKENYSAIAKQVHLLEGYLDQEVSQQLIEKRKTAEAEVEQEKIRREIEKQQAADKLKRELATLEAQAKEDRKMADKKAEIERVCDFSCTPPPQYCLFIRITSSEEMLLPAPIAHSRSHPFS